MGYSNNDKTQVFDFTQSLFNWPFRLLFSIRHSLPWQDNKKIININFSDTNFNHNQPHYHYIENIEEQEKKNNFQNIKIENNKIIEDTNEINKSHFLFHHFGKIEKLIFIFFILYKLKKTKYINSYFEKYINPYFEKIKKFMKSIV